MHHVPGRALRERLLDALAAHTAPGGILALSLWRFMDDERLPMCPKEHGEKVLKTRDEVVRRLSKLVSAGPKYVIGSDAYHGLLWHDLVFMKELGMSPRDALKGVTVNPAELMDVNAGSLEEGRIADIIAVKGNPLDDFSALADPHFVMHRGKKVLL